MTQLRYNNIFDAITADKTEAADLQFRADLMLVLREIFNSNKWVQKDVEGVLGISQPRVSDLQRGKVDNFSSDALIGFLATLGYRFRPTYEANNENTSPVQCLVTTVEITQTT